MLRYLPETPVRFPVGTGVSPVRAETGETPVPPSASAPELSVVVPVYNEEAALPAVLEEARAALADADFRYEMVVVDDASTDGSLALLSEFRLAHPDFPLRLVRHPTNRGIAGACATLFAEARGRYVFLNASDGQWSMAECRRMMPLRHEFDLVIGRRQVKQYTPWRNFISASFNLLPWLLFGVQTYDAGSIKLFRAEVLRIPLISRGPFAEAERIIRARRRGYRIGALPVEHRARRGGRATGARWSLLAGALIDLARCWWDVVVRRRR